MEEVVNVIRSLQFVDENPHSFLDCCLGQHGDDNILTEIGRTGIIILCQPWPWCGRRPNPFWAHITIIALSYEGPDIIRLERFIVY